MYNPSIPFTAEEINLIEGSGLTLTELIDFYTRFPDQNLDTAIAGCREEKQNKEAGDTVPLEADTTIYPDAPKPPEEPLNPSSGVSNQE